MTKSIKACGEQVLLRMKIKQIDMEVPMETSKIKERHAIQKLAAAVKNETSRIWSQSASGSDIVFPGKTKLAFLLIVSSSQLPHRIDDFQKHTMHP